MMRVTIVNKDYPIATCELSGKYAVLGGYLTDVYPVISAPVLKNHLIIVRAITESHVSMAKGDSRNIRVGKEWYMYKMTIKQLHTTMKIKRPGDHRYTYNDYLQLKTTSLLEIMTKWYNVIRPHEECNND